jgi:hypothetical protein
MFAFAISSASLSRGGANRLLDVVVGLLLHFSEANPELCPPLSVELDAATQLFDENIYQLQT